MVGSQNAVRWSRLNVAGDTFGVSCDADGPSIGPIRLLKRTASGFEPRFARELDFIFGAALGYPPNFADKTRGLEAVANALEKGDLARAMLITQFMWLPSLPDKQALKCAIHANALAKSGFNPDQPRDERGRWTGDGDADAHSTQAEWQRPGFIPAQAFAPEAVVPWMDQILPTEPLPNTPPFPGEILPPAVGTPGITVPRTLENPYPNDPGCAQEWADAHQYCQDLESKGQLGRGDNRGQGQSYAQCVRGRVSERCGGNPVNWGPTPSGKPPRNRPLI